MALDPPDVRAARALLKEHNRKVAKGRKRTKPDGKDPAFLAWLRTLSCIACLIEGPPPARAGHCPIEAAHQKHTDGRGAALGRRPPDASTVPLCMWHHRISPGCCDPAQTKFWDRLQVDVGAFCRALYAAFQNGDDGNAVVRETAGWR